jgi:hypothetical protein
MPLGLGPVVRPKDSHFRRGEKDLAEGVHPLTGFFIRSDSRLTELLKLSQTSHLNELFAAGRQNLSPDEVTHRA